ncbi:MAG: nucleotidyltransferase family protein [Hyphomonadaceae bacterium]|nr:nucleotidyltransferase family protein [Hyphomonadaceae bacterium]
MPRDDLLARLNALRPWLRTQGVERLRVFGSHARDTAGPESDVDLIADFSRNVSLLDLIGLQQSLSLRLGAPVDLATSAGLKARVRDRIEAEAVDA